ncbi:sperm-associated antigen 17 [Dendropsophus ebraccatus]|uniref:sperm-associated antigen 17 n=1 Tax=Dendropsophus ebraccatus TaxID=150705 RepID=UPI003831FAC5
MGPKRVKSSVSSAAAITGAPRSWEPALISAPLDEESWRVNIALVVENQEEDEVHTRALSQAVCAPQRRLFSLVSWDKVLQQVNELGNPKVKKTKDAPQYYEVTEAAKTVLDSGEPLPLPLIAKLLKFQILTIKQKDLQRREAESKLPEDKMKPKAIRSSKGKPSSAKGSAKAKGKKVSEAPPPIKKDTALKRRGEEEDTNIYIDDEPDDGAQHYIILLGVYQPQIIALLADLGVHVSSVIRISSQNYAALPVDEMESDTAADVVEAEKQRKETLRKSLHTFWKYLEPVLDSGKTGSPLSQVARLQYLVKESSQPSDWSNAEMQLVYATDVFESVACLMYDCLDWRRQHQHYLSNMQIIHVPELALQKTPEKPAPVSETPAAVLPSSPTGKKKGSGDDLTLSLPPPTPPGGQLETLPPGDVDTRVYNELLCDLPDSLPSVPVILHCMLEQVVATEKGLLPPSEMMPDPRADGLDPAIAEHLVSILDSLSLSEKEKKNLYNIFLVNNKEKNFNNRGPHLVSYHDKIRERSHQGKVPHTLLPADVEELMLRRFPVVQSLSFHQLKPEINSQRLGYIHQLMHYCNTDCRSWEEITRAFRLLTFESLVLSGFDEFGELEGAGRMLDGDGRIPWDNPAAFGREIIQISSVRKMYKMMAAAAPGGDRGDSVDAEESEVRQDVTGKETPRANQEETPRANQEETPRANQEETPRADLRDIQMTQRRSLSDWCYSEDYEPRVLIQVLQEALESYSCMDSYYHSQDRSLLLVFHNPMDAFRQSQKSWDMALHSNVSFRNYLELVADSISHWVQEEEVKYQEDQAERELEALKQVQASKDGSAPSRDPSPNKKKGRKSVSPKKSKSPKGSRSRPGSRAEETTPEPAPNPFIREGSLKAWKEEQDRLKEEERLKQEKKNTKSGKSGGKKKGGSKERPDSERRRSPSAQKKNVKEKEEGAKDPESEPAPPDLPEEPPKKAYKFIGYDVGDNMIQVSGGCRRLFPTDGGQIQVEHTHYEKGSTYIKVKIQKDGHKFLVHIVNPKTSPPGGQEDCTQVDQQGNPLSRRRGVSEFGSFSATLHSGIQLSLSHYGCSGLAPEEKDPELEAMLTFPSVHTPSIMPVPPPQPPPSSTGKGRKSPRGKSPRAARVKTPQAPAVEEPPKTPEVKVEPVARPVTPVAKPVQVPAFEALNVSYPNGLLLTFTKDNTRECCNNSQVSPRLLVRQTYPVKVRNAQLYRHGKMVDNLERSRVITAEGSVIRCLLDGSTQILLPDGTVIQSPDSGPVAEPSPTAVIPMEAAETPSADSQPAPPVGPEETKDQRHEAETKKGKGGQRAAAAKNETSEPPPPPLDSVPATPSAPVLQPGTWITTTPSGEQIGTRGSQRLDLKPLLTWRATDPVTGAVMTTREDQVVTVLQTDGTMIAEHADGTRITTYYQDIDVPLPGDHEETGEIPQSVTKTVKFIRVERSDFVTLILNSEENTCYAESGDGTEVLARPQGSYQVFPPNSGCLSISHEGRAVYSPQTNPTAKVPTRQEDLPPASYVMWHTQNIICEVLDPEGNLFQVMLDGSTSVVIAGGDNCEELEESEEKNKEPTMVQWTPEDYDLHAPRFFMVNADGSGSELLRNREVEDFLTTCYGDPTVAVIREPTQEAPGVHSITVLQPAPDSSPWTMRKHLSNIVPPNLLSRDWAGLPSIERKTPGPPLGIGIWKGLSMGAAERAKPRPPVLKCPNLLRVRQLHLYEPIGPERRETLELALKEYINRVIIQEEETRQRNIKDPRTEEEKEEAEELLQLVLSMTDTLDAPPQTPAPEPIQAADIARLYENAVAPPPTPHPPMAKPQRSVQDWEKLRQEIQEQKEQLAALRGHIVPPYFMSERGREFLQKQVEPRNPTETETPIPGTETHKTQDLLSQPPPLSAPREEEEPGISIQDWESGSSMDSDATPETPAPSPQPSVEYAAPPCADIIPARRYQPLSHSLNVDVSGCPRREKVKLPASILSGKPASVPNAKFAAVEDVVRRSVGTASTSASSRGGDKPLPRGFHLIPSVVRFGVLREGCTYSASVSIKNIGVDFCRFRVKQPPPSTGLRVTYTPGPVAAGMQTRLDLELFAMAVGLDGPEGAAEYSHCIEIQSEVETLYLPVTATVLTEGIYEDGSECRPPRVLGPGVRLISTSHNSRLELLRPRRVTGTQP